MNKTLFALATAMLGACLGTPALEARVSVALPDYRPQRAVSGVLRVQGSERMAKLMQYWSAGFRKYHPDAYFEIKLNGNSSAMPALEENIADMVVMSRQIVPYDTYGIWRRSHHLPLEFVVGTGSFDVPHKSYALTVFVSKDNPVRQLTLQQLDGIFGAQRTGGWQNMEWKPESARSDTGNIVTWGQLGVTGAWADKPVHPYGPPNLFPGGMSYFQIKVLGGADTTAEGLREYADRNLMMEAVSKDPYAIVYTGMGYRTPEVRAIALAESPAGPYVMPTKESVRDGTYPLGRSIYIYVAPDAPNGDPLPSGIDPRVREFMRYIFSRQGQQDIEREGDFLPLTEPVASEQLRKVS